MNNAVKKYIAPNFDWWPSEKLDLIEAKMSGGGGGSGSSIVWKWLQFLLPVIGPLRMSSWMITLFLLESNQSLLGFQPDSNNRIYYAPINTWQRKLGYNRFYDFMFYSYTYGQITSDIFTFEVDTPVIHPLIPSKIECTFWSWKGDYLNLGAGAETGFYFGLSFLEPVISGYYLGEQYGRFQMSLRLEQKSPYKEIFFRDPPDKQWWITGFSPDNPVALVSNLTATTTISFNNTTWETKVYEAFHKKYANDGRLAFNNNTRKVVITLT